MTNYLNNDFQESDYQKKSKRTLKKTEDTDLPPNCAKPWKSCPVPDFSDPNRKPTCLEVDFPILQVNALAQQEGNAGKPIYQMSKWWARRRSSVFRTMLAAAAAEAPDDPTEAAKLVWDHYYANAQKGGVFKNISVLEPFMGGGTTLVEGARLGMKMVGFDLNPVAWFVCKNELAGSDPEQVDNLFQKIESEVKPQLQPFYTTSCPRGHQGHWVDNHTNCAADVDPATLPPEDRKNYRWEGPEIIYTFWAKHGPCQQNACEWRTPVFRSLIIAEKEMTAQYIEITCPHCGKKFHAELGESRMAPGAELLCPDNDDVPFTTTSQIFASLMNDYNKGSSDEKRQRIAQLRAIIDGEPGFLCPFCGEFAGSEIDWTLRAQSNATRASEIQKKVFHIQKKKVQLWLLISPEWAAGVPDADEIGTKYGGSAKSSAASTKEWLHRRLENLSLIEIRAKEKPVQFERNGEPFDIQGTVTRQAHFACGRCGSENNTLEAVRSTGDTAPVAPYAMQCHCPQCEAEGYNYNGRFFKAPDEEDVRIISLAEEEWSKRKDNDLHDYWPKEPCLDTYMMKANGGVNDGWGYSHWWKMFNARQLLGHTQILKCLMDQKSEYPNDVCEQVLGGIQQYLRKQNMFCFWNIKRDESEPLFSNNNFHPKNNVVENCIFHDLGRGNFSSVQKVVIEGLTWSQKPWETYIDPKGNCHIETGDPIPSGTEIHCGSSTDMSVLGERLFDLSITDPPFGNNLFYADLADFFYVWLKIPLRQWYQGEPEEAYFQAERTPHSSEAVDNCVEHPDDREEYEKNQIADAENLEDIRRISGDATVQCGDPNPFYRPEPSGEFYSRALADCWTETGRHLKPGGLMAFTFHHNEDDAWVDVLRALFDAGYYLVATYPIRSDETKGDNAAFGSKKIEYDIIHVCRKRLEAPTTVSYVEMRRFVKSEAERLKKLLETAHGKSLSLPDLRVILRGKSLEFYSRHYGQVQMGTGEFLDVQNALVGINQLIDDIIDDTNEYESQRPPESADPVSCLFLSVFKNKETMTRDELHKTLQGTGISQKNLENRGWISATGKKVSVVPISDRYETLARRGRTRKSIKYDLDQAHFWIGLVLAQKDAMKELQRGSLPPSDVVVDILEWYRDTTNDEEIREAAKNLVTIIKKFQAAQPKVPKPVQQELF